MTASLPRIRLSPDLLPVDFVQPWSTAVHRAVRHAATDRREQAYHLAAGELGSEPVRILCSLLAQARSQLDGQSMIVLTPNAEVGIDITVTELQ